MATNTTQYNFQKPEVGGDSDNWGDMLNGNWDTTDSLLRGATALTRIGIGATNTTIPLVCNAASASDITATFSGMVGIGETSPDTELHISAAFPKILMQDTDGTSQYGEFYHSNGTTAISARDNTTNGSISFQRYDGTTATTSMRIDTSGNVGIGTTSPEAKLEVDGAKNDNLLILEGAADNFEFHVTSGDAATANSSLYRLALERNGTDNGFIDFYRGNDGTDGYLTFGSSNTERMRINSAGNVGIGTASPAYELDVTGSAQLTGGDLILRGDSTNADTQSIRFENVANDDRSAYIRADYEANSSGNGIGLAFGTNDSGQDGQTRMVLTRIGKVGIGTTSPSTDLHIKNTSAAQLLIESGETATGFLLFGDASDLNIGSVSYDHSDNSMRFETDDTERMRIDSSGNVGIGTTSPSAQLHVKNNDAGFEVDVDNQVGDGVRLLAYDRNTSTDRNMQYRANKHLFSIGSSEKMRIDSSGKVGIGATSPSELLHVTGASTAKVQISSTSTTGISGIHFGDPDDVNSGRVQYEHNTDHMGLYTNNTEKVRINSSGNVGIGTTSPKQLLTIGNHSDVTTAGNLGVRTNSSGHAITILEDGSAGAGTDESWQLGVSSSGDLGFFDSQQTTAKVTFADASGNVGIGGGTISSKLFVNTDTVGDSYFKGGADNSRQLDFSTFATASPNAGHKIDATSVNGVIALATGSTERMRIDSSGNVLVGTTDSNVSNNSGTANSGINLLATGQIFAAYGGNTANFNRLGSDGSILNFDKDGSTVGSISVTSSATAYNTSSDERLKENIQDADDAGSKIDAIQIRQFDWIADGSHQDYGVIAQELVTVAPKAVHQPEDSEDMMGVDYSKLVPMLIKEIQTLRNRVAQLENN